MKNLKVHNLVKTKVPFLGYPAGMKGFVTSVDLDDDGNATYAKIHFGCDVELRGHLESEIEVIG